VLHKLRDWFGSHPSLNLGGGFFMMAVKEGGSEHPHIDHNDYKDFMAFLIPLGDWEGGGEFCLPQLERKFTIHPGEVFACYTSRLVHFTTPPKSGTRLILTCFTDKFLAQHTIKSTD
jgi:hypothetical protein